jgi:ADP-ribose pyrophosphatase
MADKDPRTVWECPWWRVEERKFTGPDGRERTWYSAHRPNPQTVHILGITPQGEVPLLRQWRVPLQDYVWELPAGICDVEHEPPEETAVRELEEETGYRPGETHLLFTGTVSPGLTDELYSAFLSLDLELKGEGGGTGGERLEVYLLPFGQLQGFLMDKAQGGELVDSKLFTHITLALQLLVDLSEEADSSGRTRYRRLVRQLLRDLLGPGAVEPPGN